MNVIREIFNNPILTELYFYYLENDDIEKATVLLKQTGKGFKKYGRTVDYREKSAAEWREFRIEEEVDRDVYKKCELYAELEEKK